MIYLAFLLFLASMISLSYLDDITDAIIRIMKARSPRITEDQAIKYIMANPRAQARMRVELENADKAWDKLIDEGSSNGI